MPVYVVKNQQPANNKKEVPMKPKIASILMIFCLCVLWGCSGKYTQYRANSSFLTTDIEALAVKYNKIENIIREAQEKDKIFSVSDWNILDQEVDPELDSLINQLGYFSNNTDVTITLSDVQFYWNIAAKNYGKARQVVKNNLDKFAEVNIIQLQEFDERANIISSKINELLKDPTMDNLNLALKLVGSLIDVSLDVLDATTVKGKLEVIKGGISGGKEWLQKES